MPWKVKPATSQVSGKNQLRRGKPRVRIACMMIMMMEPQQELPQSLVMMMEPQQELPQLWMMKRQKSCRR